VGMGWGWVQNILRVILYELSTFYALARLPQSSLADVRNLS